jgi:hypothetical protein
MRKAINTAALIVFIWLWLDALRIPYILLAFLVAGEVPVIPVTIPPSMMLAIFTTVAFLMAFGILSRRYEKLARIRRQFLSLLGDKTARTPVRRRLGRA